MSFSLHARPWEVSIALLFVRIMVRVYHRNIPDIEGEFVSHDQKTSASMWSRSSFLSPSRRKLSSSLVLSQWSPSSVALYRISCITCQQVWHVQELNHSPFNGSLTL
ncbi:hypothetical protein FVEG_15212 [Fusarium verticillioides 7600]|uniref:Uncharacterized protein n=1 Tax=Gibberella moniliformis (strain M3125 / FGSC 7600) TaxID=334819 RepID=W7M0I2_GIBM7|nr:hypothetical protein FVEG_15212 [Fusarium verticillioides 7600]EWG41014.1 hypothetical protein FVEG_15212 [Fusarium verticillioides 7600]